MIDEVRVAALHDILKGNPDDAFARYALGLEYSGAGDNEAALREFNRLLEAHPEYTNGYFMAAQVLERSDRIKDSREMLLKGIESARRSDNRHAVSEMEAMLDQLQGRE